MPLRSRDVADWLIIQEKHAGEAQECLFATAVRIQQNLSLARNSWREPKLVVVNKRQTQYSSSHKK